MIAATNTYAILRSALADCQAQLPRVREGIQIEREPELMDHAACYAGREMAVDCTCRLVAKARAIVDALDSLSRGEYGHCQQCQLPISEARLAALPWAVRCKECEELGDRQGL